MNTEINAHFQTNSKPVCAYCGYPLDTMAQIMNTSNKITTYKHIECYAMEIELMVCEFKKKWSRLMLKFYHKYPKHPIPEQFREYLPPETTV